jgi:hypothetical protein
MGRFPNIPCKQFCFIISNTVKHKGNCNGHTLQVPCHSAISVHDILLSNKSLTSCVQEQSKDLSSSCPSLLANKKKTPWSESARELYRPGDRHLTMKSLPTFADKGCHVVSVTDPYGRILGFLDRSRYFSIK